MTMTPFAGFVLVFFAGVIGAIIGALSVPKNRSNWPFTEREDREAFPHYESYEDYRADLTAYADGHLTLDELLRRCAGGVPKNEEPEPESEFSEWLDCTCGHKFAQHRWFDPPRPCPLCRCASFRAVGDVVKEIMDPLAYGVEKGIKQGIVGCRFALGQWVRLSDGRLGRLSQRHEIADLWDVEIEPHRHVLGDVSGIPSDTQYPSFTHAYPRKGEHWRMAFCKNPHHMAREDEFVAHGDWEPHKIEFDRINVCACLQPINFGRG